MSRMKRPVLEAAVDGDLLGTFAVNGVLGEARLAVAMFILFPPHLVQRGSSPPIARAVEIEVRPARFGWYL